MRKHTLLGATVFGLASVVNPAFFSGCGPSFSFGEAEVVALVDSTSGQRYELTTAEGTYEVTFAVSQARGEDSKTSGLAPTPVKVAHACGGRTFMRSAAACLDQTEVRITGTLTVRRVAPDAITLLDSVPVKGGLTVDGTQLDNAMIRIETDKDDSSAWLQSSDGKTFYVRDIEVAGKRLERSR